MKINVPFYKQEDQTDCGIISLKMILDYFGENIGLEELKKLSGKEENKGLYTIQIAIVASKLDFKTTFFSKEVLFNEEHLKIEFYQKYSVKDIASQSKIMVEEAKKAGVEIHERKMELKEILNFISENSIPIILLNWNIINNKIGYQGHFVPVVGYDEENILVHNPGINDSAPFVKIKKEIFEKARKSDGTDEDFLVINRK
jgi:uncharacterized protein YvpB